MYFNSGNAFQISIDHGSNIMWRQMYLPSFKKKSFLFCSQNLNDRLFNIFIDYPKELLIIMLQIIWIWWLIYLLNFLPLEKACCCLWKVYGSDNTDIQDNHYKNSNQFTIIFVGMDSVKEQPPNPESAQLLHPVLL